MLTNRLRSIFEYVQARSNSIFIFCIIFGFLILSLSKLPFLWAPYGHDQGNYIYLGREILNGAVPYRDVFDHKFPGFPIINSFIWLFGINSPVPFRIFEYGWTIGVFASFVLLLQRLFTNKKLTIGIGSVFFALMLGNIFFSTADGGGYTEGYLLLPNIIAVLLLIRFERLKKHSLLFWVGLAIFTSFFIKQVGLFLFIPAIFFVIQIWYKNSQSLKQCIKPTFFSLAWMGFGFLIPIGIFFLFLYFQGALPYFYDGMVRFNQFYSGTSSLWNKIFTSIYTLHQVAATHPITYFLVTIGLGYVIFRPSRYSLLIVSWIISDVLAIGLSGWFFPHYYIQFFPVVVILASGGIYLLIRATKMIGKQYPEILLLFMFPFFLLIFIPYFSNPTINYIHRWRDVQVNTTPGSWQRSTPDLVAYINNRTEPGDYIYVWDSSQIYLYLYTQTTSSSRYYTGIPLAEMHAPGFVTPKHWEIFKHDLESNPPKVILINESVFSGIKKNPLVWGYIQNNYRLDMTSGPTEVYIPNGAL